MKYTLEVNKLKPYVTLQKSNIVLHEALHGTLFKNNASRVEIHVN